MVLRALLLPPLASVLPVFLTLLSLALPASLQLQLFATITPTMGPELEEIAVLGTISPFLLSL